MIMKKKLTPGAVEPQRALRFSTLTRSFIRLALSEATVAFRRSFAFASCLRKS